jgi:hypothetical protein
MILRIMIRATCLTLLAGLAALPMPAAAHSPVFDCFLENDSRVTCEGGFSDGASATGVAVRVLDGSEKLLLSGKIDAEGRFSFAKPAGAFHIVFDAGAGHSVTVFSNDITS